MKIALFGGTFNPPHVGHVHMVLTVLEKNLVDEVWVVPTFQNPLKSHRPVAAPLRKLMIDAAFGELSRTRIVYDELDSKAIAYTIDTIRALKKKNPTFSQSDIYFMGGSDVFYEKQKWKEIEALEKEVDFLIINRHQEMMQETAQHVLFVPMPRFDISSSDIRKRVSQGKYISHLVHPSVERQIHTNNLYVEA